MRLWSLNPAYLDRMGLLACWREGLLAQKVLLGHTKGYRNHPQLARFRESHNAIESIGIFLSCVADEAAARGYSFDVSKIVRPPRRTGNSVAGGAILVNRGQAEYEKSLLSRKLEARDPSKLRALESAGEIRLNDVFVFREGGIEKWEKVLPDLVSADEVRLGS